MLKKNYFVFVCLLLSVTGNEDASNEYDITSTLQHNIVQQLNAYRAIYQGWKNDNTLFQSIVSETLKASQQLRSIVFSSNIANISINRVEKTEDFDATKREIKCLYSDNLKFYIPIWGMKFQGNVDVTGDNFSTPFNYQYEITFKGLYFTFALHSNYSENKNDLPIDVSFKHANINVDIPENDNMAAITNIYATRHNLKLYLKEEINKQLISLIQKKDPFETVYSYCMQPKKPIEATFETFAIDEYKHYYLINKQDTTPFFDALNMDCASIKLKGLWNFDSLSMKGVEYHDVTYMMKFRNIRGQIDCTYNIVGENSTKPLELKFKIYSAEFSGSMERTGGTINNMSANFEPSLNAIICDDSWVILFKSVILRRLKNIIATSLTTSLIEKYSRL